MNSEKKNRPLNFIVGAAVIIFVCIGIFSVISFAAGKLSLMTDKTKSYKEYESLIAPVIMNDPDTFDDVSKANTDQLIAISIWAVMQDNPEPDKYKYTDGGMLLPQSEVEASFKRLFGSDVKPAHKTVDGGEIEFKYSEKKACYIIPITGITPIYTPKVVSANESSGSAVLTVGYLATEDWAVDKNGGLSAPEPAKYMRVTLRKSSDGAYYISALQSAEPSETVTGKK